MAGFPLFRKILKGGIRRFSCKGCKTPTGSINANDVYILSAVRTPIGKFQGNLSSLSVVDMGSKTLIAAIERASIPKEDVQEFVFGCVFPHGLGQGVAHQTALFGGLPDEVIAYSINKLCASGMKAFMIACQILLSNSQEVVAAGGGESTSNIPLIMKRTCQRLGDIIIYDALFHDGLLDKVDQVDVTQYAEETAKRFNVSRKEQDEYGLRSYKLAKEAHEKGFFQKEMVPLVVKNKDGKDEVISKDEEIDQLNEEKFEKLKPEMGESGTITAGNSSNLSDGASILVLARGSYVLKKKLTPLARVLSFTEVSIDRKKFCETPALVIPQVLEKANLRMDQIAMWELSETFSLTVLVNAKLLKIDMTRLNVHGGAVSMGHPFAMTGGRIIAHLAHCLKSGEYGCACISHGFGGGSAVVIEKI